MTLKGMVHHDFLLFTSFKKFVFIHHRRKIEQVFISFLSTVTIRETNSVYNGCKFRVTDQYFVKLQLLSNAFSTR